MVDNNQLGFLGNICNVLWKYIQYKLKKELFTNLCFLFLLVSDRDKNLYVYMYLPEGM